tara:strand:- start:376 stop:1011 length:636 start_codon:yes stop_codon:yes gene_type:complete
MVILMYSLLTKFIYFNNYYLFGFLSLLLPNFLPLILLVFFPYTILVFLGQLYKRTGVFGIQKDDIYSYDHYTINRFARYSTIKSVSCIKLLDKNPIVKEYYNSLKKTGSDTLVKCLHGSKKELEPLQLEKDIELISSLKKGYEPERYDYPLVFINNRLWDGRGRVSIMSYLKTPTYKIKVKKYKWSSFLLMTLFTTFLLLVHYKLYLLIFF